MFEISYKKIFIYTLTFLAYTYSGFGSGVLQNLRDSIAAAELVFGDVVENVAYVAKKFKNFHEIFDAAVDEECIFTCPGGKYLHL